MLHIKYRPKLWALALALLLALALAGCCMPAQRLRTRSLAAFERQLRRSYPCVTRLEASVSQGNTVSVRIYLRQPQAAQISAIVQESKRYLSGEEFRAEMEETIEAKNGATLTDPEDWPNLDLILCVEGPSGSEVYYSAYARYARPGATSAQPVVDQYQTWREHWSGRVLPSRMQTQRITFPAHRFSGAEQYAEELAAEPFTLTLALPDTWSVCIPSSAVEAGPGVSPVYLTAGGRRVATVDFNTLGLPMLPERDISLSSEFYYGFLYSPLMPGDGVDWDCDYSPVKQDATCCVATCRLRPDPPPAQEDEAAYCPGILAHNVSMGVYVNIAFESPAVADALVEQIAQSITLTRP